MSHALKDKRILFVLGPSGIGKSSFANFLELEHNWLHCDADPITGYGFDILKLKEEWNAFYEHRNVNPLVSSLHKRICESEGGSCGCVLTLSSIIVFTEEHIRALQKAAIEVVCLYGEKELCLQAFKKRESQNNRKLPTLHWHIYNHEIFEWMRTGDAADLLLEVFDQVGMRRNLEILLAEINNRRAISRRLESKIPWPLRKILHRFSISHQSAI